MRSVDGSSARRRYRIHDAVSYGPHTATVTHGNSMSTESG
ncbi:hypothetical protein SGL43_05769 [Streptomyces globisporus]|uniref:Uncharacterized protein n=1 Tax=Streptomyces globisporus TaxID=1908 RepID=A0ABN8V9S5_STRGL|nr:hypothetical protein SGL43_05769 [Streptomyces globisporus]